MIDSERIDIGGHANRLVGDRWAARSPAVGDVLLLHGGGQTRHAWHDTAHILAGRGWNTIAYDARGHGESAWHTEGCYGQDQMVGDLFRVAEYCASPPVLVGASMGGMASLIAAGEHPERFRALLLVDVALRVDTVESRRIQAFMHAHQDGFTDLHAVADAVHAYNPARKRSPSPDGLKRNVVQRGDGRWYWRWDPRILGQARSMDALADRLRAAARDVTVPTLLVRGQRSQMVTDQALAEFLDHIPHAQVQDIAGASHMVAGDDNNSFSRAVTDFLGEVACA
jgi:pimeloyl-ACP methyl ester carboxylesterase